jgi:hypothetical protein
LSTTPNPAPEPTARPRRRRALHIVLWTGSVLGVLLIAGFVAANIFLHRAGPMLKAKIVETLSNRFDSRVQLDQFHVAFFGGFEVFGSGLRLYPNNLPADQPLIAVDHFSFRVYDWRQLLHNPIIVNHVRVTGLSIHLPPKQQRAALHHDNQNPQPGSESTGKIDILVNAIDIDGATLVIENGKPGKVPLNFAIRRVRLDSVGPGRPLRFHAILVNPKPTGDIDSTGDFGPFDAHSPGDTPVRGQYTFRHADLGTIKGIGGILASDGSYQGQLSRIVVDGTTSTPDFRLTTADRPLPLNTKFHAIVDGTNGDTYLQPVDAWLVHTHILAQGAVVHTAGVPGRDIRLNLTVDPGRIQDMLLLAVKSPQPLLTGQMQVHCAFDLPPGKASVTDRLHLQGTFDLSDAHFTSDKIQGRVDELSLRGQGKPKEAEQENSAAKNGDAAASADIASEMRGDFTFDSSRLTLPALNFRVPGADIALKGDYTLDGQTLAFDGTARLDAHVSQMVTGWKSWLLKPVDPFFAKDGAGTLVPIKVSGTSSHPSVGLDFHHHDENPKHPAPPPQPTQSGNSTPSSPTQR